MSRLHTVLFLFFSLSFYRSVTVALPQNPRAPPLVQESPSGEAIVPGQGYGSNAGAGSASTNPGFLRGINLGGWLLVEPWMLPKDSPLRAGPFGQAKDEITLAAIPNAKQAFRKHRDTAITEADIKTIASYGINA